MNHEIYNQSKENLHNELDSLYDKLATKINEYGSKIRNTNQGSRTVLTEYLNKLKKDQFTIKQYLVDIDGTEEPSWNCFREKAEKSTETIKDNLANQIPASI